MEKDTNVALAKSTIDTGNNAVVYVRVSSKKQKEKTSPDIQLASAKEYAAEHNYNIIQVFDEARPASYSEVADINLSNIESITSTRPELQNMMSQAKLHKFQHIIVYCLDRFSRNFSEYLILQTYFKGYNVTIHFSKPGESFSSEDLDTIELFNNLKACLAELEIICLSDRIKSSKLELIKSGLWAGGKPPYGYTINKCSKKNCMLVTTEKSKHVKEIFEKYRNGFSYNKIANLMSSQYPNEKFTKGKIEYIIKNYNYTGHLIWNQHGGRRHRHEKYKPIINSKNTHSQIVDEDLWYECKSLRLVKSPFMNKNKKISQSHDNDLPNNDSKKDGKYFTTPYILRGKLICGNCNTKLIVRNYGKRGKKVYKCPKCNIDGISSILIDCQDVHEVFFNELDKIFIPENYELYWNKSNEISSIKKSQLNEILTCLDKKIQSYNSYIEQVDNLYKSSQNPAIKERLYAEKIITANNVKFIETEIIRAKKVLENYSKSKEQFIEMLSRFPSQIKLLPIEKQRYFIEILIDYIVITKIDNKFKLELEITHSY